MSTGNGNRSWRDRLGLNDQDEALPKLSDEFGGSSKAETPSESAPPPAPARVAPPPPPAKPAEAANEPAEKSAAPPPPPPPPPAEEKMAAPPPPPPAKETDPTSASPAAKSFAERLRARREAAERAGEAAGDDLGGGLHLRPAGDEKPEPLPAPTSKPEPESPSSRLIPPPAPEKAAGASAEPKPEPRAPEAAAAASEPDAVKAPPPPPPPPPPPAANSDFEDAPFKTAESSAESRPRFAPRDDRDFSSFDNPPGAPARDQGRDADYQQNGSGGRFAPRTDSPPSSYDNYRRPEPSNDYARPGTAGPSYAGNYSRDDELYDDTWYDDNQSGAYRGGHAEALNSVDDDHYEPERRRPELGRPTANDYADAYYDEYDDEYEDEEPRSRGPLLLFAGLAGVGVIAAGLIYFYLQNQPTTGPNAKIPEVAAPSQPPKTAAPKQEAPPAAQQTKLFYDRIVGETTVPGTRLQPREEQPLDPGNSAEPQPLQPLTPDQLDSGDLPVPLPPPLPGTQGSVQPGGDNGGATTQVAQSAAPTNSTSVSQVSQSEAVTPTGLTSPLPGTDDDPALPDTGVPQLQPTVNSEETLTLTNSLLPRPRAKPLAVIQAAREAAEKKKTRVASVSPITAAPTEPLSITPLPGSQPRAPTQPAPLPAVETPPAQEQPSTEAPQTRAPRVGLRDDDLGFSNGRQFAARPPAPATTPTAPAAQPQPSTPSVPSGAYVVQLASYKDQTSALAGFQELRARHPSLLSRFQPLISKKAVGNFGTFYRLQVGPMASSQAGNQICQSLLAAGEKDCLVRRR